MLRANGTPKGTVPLNVGDAVFLKTICCGWLHGTVVCFLDTGFGLSGPGILVISDWRPTVNYLQCREPHD